MGRNHSRKGKNGFHDTNYQDRAMKKEYYKGKRAGQNQECIEDANKGANDSSWYVPNQQLLRDVANLPMGISTGLPINLGNNSWMTSTAVTPPGYVRQTELDPGLMVFNVAHTIGNSEVATDPINVAANSLYSAVQSANSRNFSDYNASDLMLAILCLSDAYAAYAMLVRAYGFINYYDMLNRNAPETMIEAMGFDFDDLRANIALFRTGINQIAYALQSMYLPKDLSYVNRRIFLYENVYTDANNRKAQYYMFRPVGFYKWIEGDSTSPVTYAELLPWYGFNGQGSCTAQQALDYVWDLVDALRGSQDVRYMDADLLKAYGEGGQFVIVPIAESYALKPIYNQEVLMQMENATMLPPPDKTNPEIGFRISQDPTINSGILTTMYSYQYSNDELTGFYSTESLYKDAVLNFHKDSITQDDIIVSTRLLCRPGTITTAVPENSNRSLEITQGVASEIVLGAQIYALSYARTGQVQMSRIEFSTANVVAASFAHQNVEQAIMTAANAFELNALLSKFDWHPMIYFLMCSVTDAGSTEGAVVIQTESCMDYDNWTIIQKEVLDRMNYIALLGLFASSLTTLR